MRKQVKGMTDNPPYIDFTKGNGVALYMDIKEIAAVLVELLEDQEGVEIDYTVEDQEQSGKTA